MNEDGGARVGYAPTLEQSAALREARDSRARSRGFEERLGGGSDVRYHVA